MVIVVASPRIPVLPLVLQEVLRWGWVVVFVNEAVVVASASVVIVVLIVVVVGVLLTGLS